MKYHSPRRGRPDYLMLWFYLIWTCILVTLPGCSTSVREDLPISSDISLLDPEARGIKRERVWYQLWLGPDATTKDGLWLEAKPLISEKIVEKKTDKETDVEKNRKIWRYDPKIDTLSVVTGGDLEQMRIPGRSVDCESSPYFILYLDRTSQPVRSVFSISYPFDRFEESKRFKEEVKIEEFKRVLLEDRRELVTAGDTPLDLAISPSGKQVAVLSASGGWTGEDIIPLYEGRGWVVGQHYHQVWSLPSGLPIGKVIRLPLRSKDYINMCWSPDEKYVVYYDVFFRLVFVKIPQEGENSYEEQPAVR